jgi:Uma2 family endonuclease
MSSRAKTGWSVEEYLHTGFPDLDREYRDGELIQRSLPGYLHGKTQLLLAAFFAALRKRLSIFPRTETRMRIRSRRYVIPDLAVFWPDEPSRRRTLRRWLRSKFFHWMTGSPKFATSWRSIRLGAWRMSG